MYFTVLIQVWQLLKIQPSAALEEMPFHWEKILKEKFEKSSLKNSA